MKIGGRGIFLFRKVLDQKMFDMEQLYLRNKALDYLLFLSLLFKY